ncbi:MAG TPA: sialidase family protein [Candidatus Sulfotelmatobacter sp.]|nr:sialidase family protein [Candidatus Sulfotelmatobacter sp.]
MSSSHFQTGPRTALKLLLLWLALTAAALAASAFTPQTRLGYRTGDQWEPAMAADTHGHVYVLYPQYGAVPDCARCTAPTIALMISDDNGLTWQASKAVLPFSTGQFDPQIVVDPADHQTVYAAWLQNNKRDVVVARSLDYGRTWSFSWAERSQEDADKPVLAVRGADVYVGFNHDENFFVAASHDAGQTFSVVNVSSAEEGGSSLAGGATIDPAGNVYFGWTRYSSQDAPGHPVSVYISRSSDGGRTWGSLLLDQSGTSPDCAAQYCETGFLGAQIALTSDSAGALYALWNGGSANGGAERIYFSSSTTEGATWSARADVSLAAQGVEHGFPAIVAGTPGDVRIAWMDARAMMPRNPSQPLWNTFYRSSTNGGATWSGETRLSTWAAGYDYVLPGGFRFPFGDYFGLAIDSDGATQAVWGEGRNYKSPGSIWYSRGR